MPLSTELGRPITFTSGALAGRTVRVEIEEVQKADLGRKYARKDKRSLDPPPVVLCRFFQVLETDGARVEEEIVPDQSSLGVVCHIDLFPILHGAGHGSTRTQDTPDSPNNPTSLRPPPPLLGFEGLSMASESRETTSPVSNMSPPPTASSSKGAAGRGATPHSISEPHHTQSPGVQSDEAIARFGDYTITEGSKLTEMVSGSTFTDGVVITYNGKKSVAFVFHDLAVRMEGTFVLRYRAFSVLSERRTPPTMPVLAECYGGPFKVYPSKMFPGLAPSTELTKVRERRAGESDLRHRPANRCAATLHVLPPAGEVAREGAQAPQDG
ncbi:velvet factor-domain-containing protein [Trametes maxima]|nr:velvet factor-domain-containing protein [Trametes maxima]